MGSALDGLLPKSDNSEFEPKSIQLNIYSVMEIEAESLSHRCFFGISSCGSGFPAAIRLSGWQDKFGQQTVKG